MKTKKLTILALSTALQIALLFVSFVLPTVKISTLFAASLLNGYLCSLGFDKKYVFISYCATGILSLVLISNPIIPLGYILFFGGYGIMHYATIERKLVMKQIIRFAYLLVGLEIMYMAFKPLIMAASISKPPYLYFVPVGIIVCYVLFQILYYMLIKELSRIKALNKLILE